MVRVFVLNSGRCGSLTFARSCGHMTNFTSAHEGNWWNPVAARFDYPEQHIEIDNRLSWFLGTLAEYYPNAKYVHLYRSPDAVAQSLLRRWRTDPPPHKTNRRPLSLVTRLIRNRHPGTGIVPAFAYSMYGRNDRPWLPEERLEVCREYVRVVTANIAEFLRDKEWHPFPIEEAQSVLPQLWHWIGAEGDIEAARKEFTIQYNATGGNR